MAKEKKKKPDLRRWNEKSKDEQFRILESHKRENYRIIGMCSAVIDRCQGIIDACKEDLIKIQNETIEVDPESSINPVCGVNAVFKKLLEIF